MNTQYIKGYEVRERIGTGGFGAVYRAFQSTIGREVAIKVVLPGLANQPDFIRRFESEAQVVARLEHPHITPLYDYWRDPEGAYLVMRWLRGGSLREALQQGAFETRAAALLLDQIAGALSLAHRSGIIHRDIKPANILLDEDGNAYLTDFGIAKDLNISNGHTQPDAIVGSLDYISPEQARSEPITQRTDIYSLGVTMFEVITGHHPFENMTSVERLYKHINDPLPDITTLDTATATAVNRVIQKATAKDPDQRYADALAFAADFREAVGMNRAPTNVVELLTQREHEILNLIIEGLSNKEIAQRLTVTLSTVKWYVNQIYAKLGVRSRVQAMVRARELNLLTRTADAPHVTPIPTEDFHPENPYKGLRAFTAADHKDFFGREKLTEKLLKKLEESGDFARFLAVVGPSGSGKSSLVKAGLIPAIWKGALPRSEKWFVVEMLPGSLPLDELEIALIKVAAQHASSIREQLQRDENGLVRAAQLILPNDGSELLLVIDQFEEVFTLVEDEQARQHFLNLLHAAVTAPRSRVRVVVTMRADFYDRPLHYPHFGELVRSRMETILPLSAEELERAVAEPAKQEGVTFEPGLISTIVAEVKYQPGALPLLQYALTELFERREGRLLTREAYQAIGGTVGALAKRADEIYASLDDDGREAVRQMFLRLVTLGEGTEDTRRRTPRSELLAITSDTDLMDEVIDTYAEYRLLSLDNDPATRTPTVEVAHEAILREWELLRVWLNESREDVRLQRQVSTLAGEWHSAKQDTSFLVRGARLEMFEKWAGETQLALTEKERIYVQSSMEERQREQQAEETRRTHELRLAQEAAEQAQKAMQSAEEAAFAAQQAAVSQISAANRLRQLVAVFVVSTLMALGLSGFAFNQRQEAESARIASDANAHELQRLAVVFGAQASLDNGDTDSALALALEANRIDPLYYQTQITLAQAAYARGTIRRFEPNAAELYDATFSPDGRTIATSSQDSTEILLWDIETGEIIRRFRGHTDTVDDVAFSPDGQTLLSGSGDASVRLWDVATGEQLRRFVGHTDWVDTVAFSPDGRLAISGADDNRAIVWDIASGERLQTFLGHTSWVMSAVFSADGQSVFSVSWNEGVVHWDIETGEVLQTFFAEGVLLQTLVVSPDNSILIAGGDAPDIIVWDIATGEQIRRLVGHNSFVTKLALSPDGRRVLSGSWDATMILWDIATGDMIHQFRGHTGVVYSVAFSLDGQYALSGSFDSTVRLWDLVGGNITQQFTPEQPIQWVLSVSVSPDDQQVLTSGVDSVTVLWDLVTGAELQRFDGMTSNISPDGRLIALGRGGWATEPSPDPAVVIDLATGQQIQRFSTGLAGVLRTVFSPSGTEVLLSSSNNNVSLWDVQTGERLRTFIGNTDAMPWLAFSPDGSQVIGGGRDGGVVVWNTATGEIIHRLEGHTDFLASVSFSGDGQRILTSAFDNSVIVWDAVTGEIIHRFTDHSAAAFGAVFSPDGQMVISGSADNTLMVWDVESGRLIRQFTGLHAGIFNVGLSSDGSRLFVGFLDGTVQEWRFDTTDSLVDWTLANRYIPELTCEQRELYRLEPLCAEATPLP